MTTATAEALRSSGSRVPASPVAVELNGLTKRFPVRRRWPETVRHPFQTQYVPVVQGVSCRISRGEFFGLLGHNGAGKTTLFKMLATLVTPDEGTATVEGYDVVHDAARVRGALAPVIADERSLSWRLSARENLRLYAVLQGLRGTAVRARTDELLEVVDLAGTGETLVGKFSSGMKQRLLIARALLARPRVLLLDEPTRSLDPISARQFRAFLRDEITGRQGCTVLLATHNTEEALDLCDRVAVLDHGRLLAVGTAADLSRQVGENRHRVWTRVPDHPSFAALAARKTVEIHGYGTAADGWTPVDIDIPGGPDRAAEALAFLSASGAEIAAFERVRPSLADLIERVVEHRGMRAHA